MSEPDDTRPWPAGLKHLAEIIGPAAAVRLADAFGGVENIYIPKAARIDHDFTDVIGLDRLELLCAEFGGERISIPRGTHRSLKKFQIMDAEGTNRQVAMKLRVSQRYVRRIRSRFRKRRLPDLLSK